jgi:hypothetical protein
MVLYLTATTCFSMYSKPAASQWERTLGLRDYCGYIGSSSKFGDVTGDGQCNDIRTDTGRLARWVSVHACKTRHRTTPSAELAVSFSSCSCNTLRRMPAPLLGADLLQPADYCSV